MVVLLFLSVIALVGLALHFMQEAVTRQEFSLMIAGTLIAASSAGIVGVYLLIGHSVTDRLHGGQEQVAIENAYESIRWYVDIETQAQEPNSVFLSDPSTK
ncbi:MAG: hypothetical protein LH631_07300 [Alkalinema sp. CAN_BIN05]|nr:hypothetical protein [Alkalinema sp. CAN_BIN05]